MSDPQKTCWHCGTVFSITPGLGNAWVWAQLENKSGIAYFCSDSCYEQYREDG